MSENNDPDTIRLTIDDTLIELPVYHTAAAIYRAMPPWMKSSKADCPDQKSKAIRLAIKNLLARDVRQMGKQLYGPTFELGRDDPMPVIAQWMIAFGLSYVARNPLELKTDAKFLGTVRPGNEQTTSTQTPCYDCQERAEGSIQEGTKAK